MNGIRNKENSSTLKHLIFEGDDDGSGDYGYYSGQSGVHGYGYGGSGGYSPNDGKPSLLFDPLMDIAKTALWGVQRLVTTIRLAVPAVAKALFFGIVPFSEGLVPGHHFLPVSHVFDQFSRKEEQELHKLDSKYRDVLERNIKYLKSNDAWGLALLLYPDALIAEKLLEHSPEVAYFVVNTLSGGWLDDLSKRAHAGDYSLHERFFETKPDEALTPEQKTALQQALGNGAALESFPGFQQLAQVGRDILVSRFDYIASAATLQDLNTRLPPENSKALKEFISKTYRDLGAKDPEATKDPKQFAAGVLKAVKESFRDMYVSQLNQFPPSEAVNAAIKQIKARSI